MIISIIRIVCDKCHKEMEEHADVFGGLLGYKDLDVYKAKLADIGWIFSGSRARCTKCAKEVAVSE